jgi:transposase
MNDKEVRGQYTQEFKFEAVRLVKEGQSVGMTAKVLGIPSQSGQLGAVQRPRSAWRRG